MVQVQIFQHNQGSITFALRKILVEQPKGIAHEYGRIIGEMPRK